MERRRSRLLLVTGMSGAGKSTVLDVLEDLGWDCADNLPLNLVSGFVDGAADGARLAIGMDVRSRGFDPATLRDSLHAIPNIVTELLYIDCSGNELLRRYAATRRRHPLAPDRPAEDGIARERASTATLRHTADSIIDTTELTPADLREELIRRYGSDAEQPVLTLMSFGFARGIARTADLVFDLRFLANPHWVDDLRPLTGEDAPVQDYVAADPAWSDTVDRLESLLTDWIPRYWAAGKNYVTVAFGCTGGRHRSVAAAVEMAERLRGAGFSPNVRHRDLPSPPRDTIEGDRRSPVEAS
ncbi:RNase adapter RapZ [Sphingomonas piscis]|uniref:RNase adapter RapZ n=1 Tax=Sphingomonas piscis TaxID=2714943 RepID=A0A6G7YSR6_9SPHN|nr:RNase adapter RapZ [Sphingomonas piscis]QIK79786.1 RNase adapter RapZ [Sphingomonas piscis]